MIRTPDHRVRVFVSSTLQELAAERLAARAAIEQLRLAPVMFELGARPHPPAELYRAYLAQSDIFVGLYWERYGWVAPDAAISGLEDEWRLASDHPRLVYIKEPAPGRESRLDTLLDQIRDANTTSYRAFGTPEELRELLVNDLAVLLSERFDLGSARPPAATTMAGDDRAASAVPHPPTGLIGRQEDLAALVALVDDDHRLVTITGTGGCGKTRLALEAAARLRDDRGWHTVFADLTGIRRSELVLPTVASALGVLDPGDRTLVDAITEVTRARKVLAVVDNFEHVIDRAGDLADILAATDTVHLLVTSRRPLHLRWEQEFPLHPLGTPDPEIHRSLDAIATSPAVELLVDRVRRVRPDFSLDERSASDLADLARRLDGLPLALELAAARLRTLRPDELLDRLHHRLDTLSSRAPDLPDRHHTLRSTIEWSHEALTEEERLVFRRLGVFADGAGIGAAEAVCSGPDVAADRVLDLLESLVDASMVVTRPSPTGTRFALLETLREFAIDELIAAGEAEATFDRHLDWFASLAEQAWTGFWQEGMERWLDVVDAERANFRVALDHAAGAGDPIPGLRLGASMWPYWDVRGQYREGAQRLRTLLDLAPDAPPVVRGRALNALGWAVALLGDFETAMAHMTEGVALVRTDGTPLQVAWSVAEQGNVAFSLGDADTAEALFAECHRLASELGEVFLTGHGIFGAAYVAFLRGDLVTMRARIEESVELSKTVFQPWGVGWAEFSLGILSILEGDEMAAARHITESLRLRWSIRDVRGLAESIQLLANLASSLGDLEWSALLHGAAELRREAVGLTILPFLQPMHDQSVARLTDAFGADRLRELWDRGRSLPLDKLVTEALNRNPPAS